jgi:hypothetical protein
MVREKLLVFLMLRRGPLVLHDMGLCARNVSRGITALNRDYGSKPRPANLPVINDRFALKIPKTGECEHGVATP